MEKKIGFLQRLGEAVAKARERKLTIMLVPETSDKIRQIRIPMLGIYLAGACVVALIAATAYIYSSTGSLRVSLYHERTERQKQVRQNARLLAENQEKDAALNRLYQETVTLKSKMTELEELSEQINTLMRRAGQPIVRSRSPLPSRGGGVERTTAVSTDLAAQVAVTNGRALPNLRTMVAPSPGLELIAQVERNLTELEAAMPEREQGLHDLKATLEEYNRRLDHTPSIWPVRGWVTSNFGSRINPITGRRQFHEGLDIAVPYRTPVRATADGVVIWAGYRGGYGLAVIIDHGYGLRTLYAHNAGIAVKVGHQVKKGEIIAYSGNSGDSTGPHLHYEVLVGGEPVNPFRYLP